MQNQIRFFTANFGRLTDQVFLEQDSITRTKATIYMVSTHFSFTALRHEPCTKLKSRGWKLFTFSILRGFLES